MLSQRCEPQQTYKETSLLQRRNNFALETQKFVLV